MKVTQAQLREMEGNGAKVTRSGRDSPATSGQQGGVHINVPTDELEAAIAEVGSRVDALGSDLQPKIAAHDERLVQFIGDVFEKLKAHDDNTNGHRDEIIAAINELELEVELPEYEPQFAALLRLAAENAAAIEMIGKQVQARPKVEEWDLAVQRDQSVEGDYKPITSIRMKAVR